MPLNIKAFKVLIQSIYMSSKDYISGLPDCLISHILSFLSTKEAASTSVLAKRWRYLFALTPNLDFDDSVYLNPENKSKSPKSFVYFVDRVLVLHQNVPLNRFSLKCEDVIHPSIVVSWLLKVLERGVSYLDLHISSEMGYLLPSDMFVSETLVRLKIGVRDVLTIDKVNDVFLPNIKSLCLNVVMVKNSFLRKFLSGCQALEELVRDNLSEVKGSYSVSHNTLKRLVVRRSRTFDENHKRVSFSTPNLVYLDYSDTIADKYPKVEFSSLVEARLDLRMTKDQLVRAKVSDDDLSLPEEMMVGDATNFLIGICSVKILHLSSDTLEVLTYCSKPIPAFNNLIHITIQTDLKVSWESIPALLKNCPKLETLVFEGLHYGDTNSTTWEGTSVWLSSSPLKKLKVFKFGEIFFNIDDLDNQMDMIKYFVEAMPNLEEVVLYCDTRGEDDLKIVVSTAFQMLEKVASTKCKIRVVSDKTTLSSTVYSTSSTAGLI